MANSSVSNGAAASGGGGGAGDVVGPASSTATAIPVFTDTTGKLINNSGVKIDASNNLQIPIASSLIFGGFTGGSLMWETGSGLAWNDAGLGVGLHHDIQSITNDRTVTWPDATGTVVVGSATGTTVGAAGAASVLPIAPLGYLSVALPNGTVVKIPYYTS